MGNHTQSAEGGAYAARAKMRASGRATAAAPQHPLETPIVHASPLATPPAAAPAYATRTAKTASPRQPNTSATRAAQVPKAKTSATTPTTPRSPVASSAALAFHRANRPAGSTLNTIGPGLYRMSIPGMAPRVVTGQELNAAFREASRANRQGMRQQARQVRASLHPKAEHHAKGEHGNLGREALHHYHRTLHTLGRLMGH